MHTTDNRSSRNLILIIVNNNEIIDNQQPGSLEPMTSIKGVVRCLTYFGGSAECLILVCYKRIIEALSKADKGK